MAAAAGTSELIADSFKLGATESLGAMTITRLMLLKGLVLVIEQRTSDDHLSSAAGDELLVHQLKKFALAL
jgi:hypothetical protein